MKWNNTCIFFLKFFPHLIITENWVEFPVLYSSPCWLFILNISSVQSVMSDSLQPHGLQLTRLPCPSPVLELAQAHVHQVIDAIQPSHLLSAPSPPAFNLSQHQGLFQWVSSSHQVAKVLELQLQQQSFQWIFRTDFPYFDWLDLLAVQGTLTSHPVPQL